MTDSNEQTNQDSGSAQAAASKARHTAAQATAPVSEAANTVAEKTDDVASAGKDTAERTARTVSGAAHTAAKSVEAGRQTVIAASGQAAAVAKTTWTVIAQRKLVAAGVGAGLTALSATSYAVGRRAGRHTQGPLTRMTGGRL